MDQFYMPADAVQIENAPTHAVVGKKAAEEFRRTGRTNGGFAILDKDKVTFGGKCFVKKGSSHEEQRVDWSVSANEIFACTYTRFTNYVMLVLAIAFPVLGLIGLFSSAAVERSAIMEDNPIGLWIIFCLSLIAFGSLFIVRFIKSRRSFFEIATQGMSICIDMSSLERGEDIAFRNAIQNIRTNNPANPYTQMNKPW